jgi:dihydrofolate reductase
VTDGIDSSLAQAKSAAGDKAVAVMGGANIIQEVIAAGLGDELRIHVAPVVLGAGTRLFDHLTPERLELEAVEVSESAGAANLIFQVRPAR